MKEKICKKCGQIIDKRAIVCPSCGVKIKKPILKKWWFWWLFAVVICFTISIFATVSENTNNTNRMPTVEINTNYNKRRANSQKRNKKKNSPRISKTEFEDLETGMTYNKVVSIIGGEGELVSQADVAGYDTKMYTWKGEGFIGANANVTFQNNRLIAKAQFGLK